jgi:hypothetical protein
VLEFARLEKGTRDMALVSGPVLPVVREAVDLVRPHLDAQGSPSRSRRAASCRPSASSATRFSKCC